MTAPISAAGGEVVFYEAADGELRLEVRPLRERVWQSQAQMALLFGRERSVVIKQLRNVFREGELDEESNVLGRLRALLAETGEATALLGRERGDQLDGLLGAIDQTFGGTALHPSVESRAAHSLYFVIKHHPFSDGDKRIGALPFLEFLARNGALLLRDGRPRFADNALVALALPTAGSDPAHKDLMTRLTLDSRVDPAAGAHA